MKCNEFEIWATFFLNYEFITYGGKPKLRNTFIADNPVDTRRTTLEKCLIQSQLKKAVGFQSQRGR